MGRRAIEQAIEEACAALGALGPEVGARDEKAMAADGALATRWEAAHRRMMNGEVRRALQRWLHGAAYDERRHPWRGCPLRTGACRASVRETLLELSRDWIRRVYEDALDRERSRYGLKRVSPADRSHGSHRRWQAEQATLTTLARAWMREAVGDETFTRAEERLRTLGAGTAGARLDVVLGARDVHALATLDEASLARLAALAPWRRRCVLEGLHPEEWGDAGAPRAGRLVSGYARRVRAASRSLAAARAAPALSVGTEPALERALAHWPWPQALPPLIALERWIAEGHEASQAGAWVWIGLEAHEEGWGWTGVTHRRGAMPMQTLEPTCVRERATAGGARVEEALRHVVHKTGEAEDIDWEWHGTALRHRCDALLAGTGERGWHAAPGHAAGGLKIEWVVSEGPTPRMGEATHTTVVSLGVDEDGADEGKAHLIPAGTTLYALGDA